ncbi:MAG TPA: cupredoxin domain-containing protein [Thermoleophilaceae bacterium]|jgi:plastocyanin
MNRKLLALALTCTALAVGACGDDEEDSSNTAPATTATEAAPPAETTTQEDSGGGSSGATKLEADADPNDQLKFTVDQLDAKAGTVTITMKNPSNLPHAIEIEGNGVEEEGETVQKGGTSTVTADLKPGEYEFYCPVPGHKEGGMKGTLTVK